MRHIKRYTNRKLYDTDTSQYTTLERIAQQVRTGDEIQVIQHPEGTDITAYTFAQVLYEEISSGRSNVSVEDLRAIICNGIAMPDGDYFSKPTE